MSAMYQTFQNTPIFQTAWRGFLGSKWTDEVNVRDFIQNNYTQYDGDESFLAAPTSATHLLWERLQKLQKEEHEKGGVLECETEIVSSLTAYGPGYIDPELKDLERIVGLQTDKPLKRAFMPFGGIKMAEEAAETYGYHVNPKFHKIFTEYHKTHNQAVFIYPGNENRPPLPYRHRASGYLWTRPDRRRLPPDRPVRNRFPNSGKEKGSGTLWKWRHV